MKIFFCDNRLGGLLGFRADIIRHFVEAGHEVVLLAPKAETEWEKIGEKIEGAKIVSIPIDPSGLNPFKDFKLLCFLTKFYKKEKPDIIFNYTVKPNIYSAIAGKIHGIKVIDMLAGLGFLFNGKGVIRKVGKWMYRYGLNKADKVLTLNEMNRKLLLGNNFVHPNKLIMLKGGEGINLKTYPHLPVKYDKGLHFIVVSRVLVDKGYNEFVTAAEKVHALYPNVHMEWLGPTDFNSPMGISETRLKQDINRHIINYMGVTHNVQDFLNRDGIVVVLPSYHEGMSRSLMEACAIGRPIITSDISGCKETVDDGINGYLVPKGDADSLAEAMLRFINLTPEEKTLMAKASRLKAERCFDVKDVIKVYDQILEEKR